MLLKRKNPYAQIANVKCNERAVLAAEGDDVSPTLQHYSGRIFPLLLHIHLLAHTSRVDLAPSLSGRDRREQDRAAAKRAAGTTLLLVRSGCLAAWLPAIRSLDVTTGRRGFEGDAANQGR